MLADTGLVYSSPDWEEILKSFDPITDNRRKLTLEPYPSMKVLAAFAKLAYSDCAGELDLPESWDLLTTAQNKRWYNGYFGCAFWNPSQQQIVIAHRGTTNLGSLLTDLKGVYLNKYNDHMSSAVSFADEIKRVILETNRRHAGHLRLSIAGHSLGAWLAGVTTWTVKYLKREGSGFCRITNPDEGLHAHTLALDSPGVEDMLIKICRKYDVRYDRSTCIKQLDITTFFAAANVVNSTGYHVGGIYQMHIERDALSRYSTGPTLSRNLHTHSLEHFIKAFHEGKDIYTVKDWPQGKTERKDLHKQEKHCNSYISRLNAEIWQGNTCHLAVFSTDELKFINNWSLFQSHTIMELTEIDQFISLKNLDKLVVPRFEMDTRRNTIICETKEDLEKLIGQIKQLLRWFPDIMGALFKQNRNIKSAPLYFAGLTFLCTLPDILDCEDTLGLEPFLESSKQRVLQIQTSDGKFEAARLCNILNNLKNPSLEKTYLNKNCHTFLGSNVMASIAKDMNIEGLITTDVTNDNLLILVSVSETDNLPDDILRKILSNLEKCSHKKLVLILSQTIDSNLFMDYNLIDINKAFELFKLSDLTLNSREEILTRASIALGEKTLSLNTLLGADCKSNDEQVRNRINKIISPILKELVTDHQHIAEIPNKLPRLCELDALYSKCNKHVSKEGLVALLETTGSSGPLVVISDPEQLSQDYWGEVAVAARERIFTTAVDRNDLFLEKCRKEPARVIYWLHLCVEGLILREIYNGGIYISRKFYTRYIIKSMDAFVRYNGNTDLFIFNNVQDKLSLISSFKLSGEAVQLFVSADHFKIRNRSEEINTEDKKIEQSLVKHFFKLLTIEGSPCLVWQYSHGSLDGLRPFIARDDSDPIEEDAFYNTRKKKKLDIIADDAGMGKTTSLTRMSELIQDYWVLRIDHKHLKSALDGLPPKLTLESVTDCLILASGLPPKEDFGRSLLQHCLESDNSRQVCVLVDAFDEITEKKTKENMVELLKYLKNFTKCKTVVTTRVYPQKGLENDLAEFSAEFVKITETEQEDYMVNFWLPHLALELPKYGVAEKGRLRQFAKDLRKQMEEVLGGDVASFMGIPLQIRMLADVFLQQAIQSVVSHEQVTISKIINLFDLYKRFIEVKKTIYFEQKINIKESGLPHTSQNDVVTNIMEKHRILAFQVLDQKFAAEYFTKKNISDNELTDVSRLGLIRSNKNGTPLFIHRTFVEYICADFVVEWIREGRQSIKKNRLVKNELSKFFLRSEYYIIRKFIEAQLDTSPIHDDILEKNPRIYQYWWEHRQLFLHDRDKTPLHVAAEEQNTHIVSILLSGPSSKTSDEAFISFIAARDKAGKTALNIALENGSLNIVNQMKENVAGCSYESLLEILLATILDAGCDRHDYLLEEYCLNTQQLTGKKNAFRRIKEIRKQFILFIAAVRDNNYETVQKILSGMESDTERAYLMIAIDSQGDTAINLATSKKHNMLFKLFAKQEVRRSYDALGQNPLHCAAAEGHTSIVKFLLNQTKETYESITNTMPITIDNDNYQDEDEATTVQNDATFDIFFQINCKKNNGDTALSLAALGGYEEVVSVLLQHDKNLISQSNKGTTILTLAEYSGSHDQCCEPLQNVVNIHSTNKVGWTALHCAARNGNHDIVRLLLEKGADIHTRNDRRLTALHCAATNGHHDTVRLLLEEGADIHTRDDRGWTALHLAASNGHHDAVRLLLEKGADIHTRNDRRLTALHYAASNGHHDTVRLLLEEGADIHTRCDGGWTALHCAASKGHHHTVRLLLEEGADIHTRCDGGWTALPYAASNGHHDTVRLLLEEGADIHTRHDGGWTALHYAASKGHHDTVRLLLEEGADIHTRCDGGWTALHIAASKGHHDTVRLLLQEGADIHTRDDRRLTALHWAASKGHHDTVRLLLEKGADIHTRDDGGWTALHLAASNGHHDTVRLLLEEGADIHTRDDRGWTALHRAASNGHHDTVRLLLEKGADIHTRDDRGWTALHYAASKGHHDTVRLLLEKGADIHTRDDGGWTALHYAASKGHHDTVRLLLEEGADIHTRGDRGWTALHHAASNGNHDTVRLLLEEGADIHTRDDNSLTALHTAASNGHGDTVRLLLEEGADIHTRDDMGWTALHYAASNGHHDTVRLLLEEGADIHTRDDNSLTALHLAASNGHGDTVRLLLEEGADIHTRDDTGWTALHYAASDGHHDTVRLLLEEGADIHTRDDTGWTALHLAASKGYMTVVDILLVNGGDLHSLTQDGLPALHIAVASGHHDTVRLLLEEGADIHTRNDRGVTALHWAASSGHHDTVRLLLEEGADIHTRHDRGGTALHWAAREGHHDTVRLLLEKGADIHTRNNIGLTALNWAASLGHQETCHLLLTGGADIDSRDEDGDSAFLQAAANGHANIVTLLLQRGVDVNSQRDDGRTALSWAAHKGQLHTLEVLLQHKADVSRQDKEGKTALSWAEERGHQEIVDLLRRHQEATPDESGTPLV